MERLEGLSPSNLHFCNFRVDHPLNHREDDMSTHTIGRPRKFRNNAEKQKVYRANKKQRESLEAALRNRLQSNREQRIRKIVRSTNWIQFWHIYGERIIQPQEDYYACPCGSNQVPASEHGAASQALSCGKCRGTIAGAIRYFESQHGGQDAR